PARGMAVVDQAAGAALALLVDDDVLGDIRLVVECHLLDHIVAADVWRDDLDDQGRAGVFSLHVERGPLPTRVGHVQDHRQVGAQWLGATWPPVDRQSLRIRAPGMPATWSRQTSRRSSRSWLWTVFSEMQSSSSGCSTSSRVNGTCSLTSRPSGPVRR